MTINAESKLIIYTMMDLKLAVNIQGRIQSNHLGWQFSLCHLHVHSGLKANRIQGITIKELEKSEAPSQPFYELAF